jgi:hypothetical protein
VLAAQQLHAPDALAGRVGERVEQELDARLAGAVGAVSSRVVP